MRRTRFILVTGLAIAAGCGDATGPGDGGAAFQSVTAGDRFTCALRSDGQAFCWGQALFGQIGDSATTPRSRPVAVAGDIRFRAIAAGSDHVCGIAQDSTAWCWGLNDYLELGSDATACNPNIRFVNCANRPQAVDGGLRFDSISVGGYATCGLVRAAGGARTAWCWGWNTHGEMGLGTIGDVVGAPAPVDGNQTFAALSLNRYHACAVDGLGSLFCWGSNIHGQLGADTIRTPRCDSGPAFDLFCAPAPILSAIGRTIRSVSAGGNHTCALDASGAAWCWGTAQEGALGTAAAAGGPTPLAVSGGREYRMISAGDTHSCAITDGGQAWCWGINDAGQLGTAAPTDLCPAFGSAKPCNRVPVAVAGAPDLTRISAGYDHTCGISTRGEVWCWGRGTEGQLGDGERVSSGVPVRVGPFSGS